jgi:ABC-type dipeptide/oligopeptide/nickel transport system ATPase component
VPGAIVVAVFASQSILEGGALAIAAQLLDLLSDNSFHHKQIAVICSVHEVVVAAELVAVLMLDGHVVEEALVDAVTHHLEDLVLILVEVLARYVEFHIELSIAEVAAVLTPYIDAKKLTRIYCQYQMKVLTNAMLANMSGPIV